MHCTGTCQRETEVSVACWLISSIIKEAICRTEKRPIFSLAHAQPIDKLKTIGLKIWIMSLVGNTGSSLSLGPGCIFSKVTEAAKLEGFASISSCSWRCNKHKTTKQSPATCFRDCSTRRITFWNVLLNYVVFNIKFNNSNSWPLPVLLCSVQNHLVASSAGMAANECYITEHKKSIKALRQAALGTGPQAREFTVGFQYDK